MPNVLILTISKSHLPTSRSTGFLSLDGCNTPQFWWERRIDVENELYNAKQIWGSILGCKEASNLSSLLQYWWHLLTFSVYPCYCVHIILHYQWTTVISTMFLRFEIPDGNFKSIWGWHIWRVALLNVGFTNANFSHSNVCRLHWMHST